MINTNRKFKYKTKIRLSMIMFSIIPSLISFILLFCFISIPKINQIQRDKLHYFTSATNQIDAILNNVIDSCGNISTNTNIAEIFSSEAPSDMSSNLDTLKMLSLFFSSFTNSHTGNVEDIVIYHNNDNIYKNRFSKPLSNLPHKIDISDLENEKFIWFSDDVSLYLYKKIQYTSNDITSVIVYTIPKSTITKIWKDFNLVDNIIYINSEKKYEENNSNNLKTASFPNGDTAILTKPVKLYLDIYINAFITTFTMFILMVIIILVSSFLTTKNLTSEIYTLIDMVKNNFINKISYTDLNPSSELAPIYIKLKSLVNQIDSLNEQNLAIEQSKNMIELQYIQSKINPHLLYNSLSTIKWKCIDVNPTIAQNIDKLVDYYRFTVYHKHIITFQTEAELIKKYITLMSATHSCDYSLSLDLSDEILNCKTIMHIFQPFVENSILHGIRNIQDGKISIIGHIEDNLLSIEIADNGVGIQPERLKQIKELEYDSKYHSFGIKNTIQRIKLFYDDNCSVDVHSVYGNGTTVKISIHNYKSIKHIDFS